MDGSVVSRGDVDADDPAVTEEIADRGQEKRAASLGRTGFNDEVRFEFVHDLLVDPEVQRAFLGGRAQPECRRPGSPDRFRVVVELVEGIDDLTLGSWWVVIRGEQLLEPGPEPAP